MKKLRNGFRTCMTGEGNQRSSDQRDLTLLGSKRIKTILYNTRDWTRSRAWVANEGTSKRRNEMQAAEVGSIKKVGSNGETLSQTFLAKSERRAIGHVVLKLKRLEGVEGRYASWNEKDKKAVGNSARQGLRKNQTIKPLKRLGTRLHARGAGLNNPKSSKKEGRGGKGPGHRQTYL